MIAAKQIDIIRQGTAKVTFQLLDSSFMQEYLDQNIKNTTLNEPISQLISDTDSYKTNQQYYIRLASFKLKKNAELLIAKNLTKIQKQHTSIHKSKYKRKALYKVIMGPFSTKEEANIEIAKLQSHFKDVLLINNILH